MSNLDELKTFKPSEFRDLWHILNLLKNIVIEFDERLSRLEEDAYYMGFDYDE